MDFVNLVNTDEFINSSPLSVVIGEGDNGEVILTDIQKAPHMIVGGASASGKTNFLFSIVLSLLLKNKASDLKIITVEGRDGYAKEYEIFEKIKQVKTIYDFEGFTYILKYLVNEMELRYSMLQKAQVRNIEQYNNCEDVVSGRLDKLPYIVVILDEIVSYLINDEYEINNELANRLYALVQKSRASGIHIILSSIFIDRLPRDLLANIPTRICFKIDSYLSRLILDGCSTDGLDGKGICLYKSITNNEPKKVKCPHVNLKTIQDIMMG